jgi:hypothetical protein
VITGALKALGLNGAAEAILKHQQVDLIFHRLIITILKFLQF